MTRAVFVTGANGQFGRADEGGRNERRSTRRLSMRRERLNITDVHTSPSGCHSSGSGQIVARPAPICGPPLWLARSYRQSH